MTPREQMFAAFALAFTSFGWLFAVADVRYLLKGFIGHVATVGITSRRRRVARNPSKEAKLSRCRAFLGHEAATYKTKVRTYDTDLFMHLSNSKYLKEGDFARFQMFLNCGLWEASYNLGIPIVVACSTIRHRKELPMFKPFQIISRVVGYDEVSVFMEQRFVSISAKTGKEDLNALLFVRMQLTNKGKMRSIFEYWGIETMLPMVSEPPTDVLMWLRATQIANNRIKSGYGDAADEAASALSTSSPAKLDRKDESTSERRQPTQLKSRL